VRATRRRAAEGVLGGLRDGSRKRGLRATIQKETEREILALVGRSVGRLDLEAIEGAARRVALAAAARALERQLNQDHSDSTAPGAA
jgi:hypothetical protein